MDDKLAELFGKVKSTAASAYSAAEIAAKTASKKVGESIDTTKTNIKIYNLNNERKELFAKLGELVYNTQKGVSEDSVRLQELVSAIDAKSAEIEALSEAEVKESTVCPHCGASCSAGAESCSVCGKPL